MNRRTEGVFCLSLECSNTLVIVQYGFKPLKWKTKMMLKWKETTVTRSKDSPLPPPSILLTPIAASKIQKLGTGSPDPTVPQKYHQWGRVLGSSRTLFVEDAPFCRSVCSEMVRLKLRPWPLIDPRCHLQISPLRISWICCTMRLMATDDTQMNSFFS